MDEEFEEIELLGDEFHHALLGAVFEQDGTPACRPAQTRHPVVRGEIHLLTTRSPQIPRP